MKNFSELKKNLKKDFTGLKRIKAAILGDTATQFLKQVLRAYGYEHGIDLELWEADFNQIELQVFNNASELYEFNPELVILFQSSHKLNGKYSKLSPGEYTQFAAKQLHLISELHRQIASNLQAQVIYYNYPEIDDGVFGNYANKTEQSFLFQLRRLNYELMLYASQNPGFHICDLSSIQNLIGKAAMFQTTLYVNTEMVLSLEAMPHIAAKTLALIEAMDGKFKKCIILDLDNTMWGGVIGDDGLESIQLGTLGIGKAFTELQYWVKKLKNRGIIIAVCSKNTESVAIEPFEKHPEMVLHMDDIAIFMANWDNKADNIRKIQSVLNIGFDSMVFLDDNPFERNMVRENLPEVTVPELPVDPADYLEYLYTLNLFETTSFSSGDTERTKQYQAEAKRTVLQSGFINEDAFLESLNMVSLVEPFNKFNTPRVAQLSQRSNQFNLRTVRYTEADIKLLSETDDVFTYSFSLEDSFGDNGLISLVILKKESRDTLFIDSWLMSCRVLKRGMENFILNTISKNAKNNGYKYLKGEYIATAKNDMVKYHYKNLNFKENADYWILNITNYENKKSFISGK